MQLTNKPMIGRLIIRIVIIINALAIIGLLIAYLAAYVSPLTASWISMFSLAYPYFVFANVAFALGWLFVKKWYFLLSLTALLIGIKSLQNNFQFLPTKIVEVNEQKPLFKVMSYNVRVFDLYSWSKNIQTQDSIFDFLRSVGPEIACFQEYYDNKKKFYSIHDSLIMNQKFKYAHIYYTDKVTDYQRFGIATYSQYPIVNKGLIRFPNSNNVSIYSDVRIGSDTVRVFNCHLESIRFLPEDYNFIDSIAVQQREEKFKGARGVYQRLDKAYKKRALQTELLNSEISKSPYPILLCGDFNDPPSSYTYNSINKQLNDSFVFKGRGKGVTFSRNVFSYRIDYILFSKHLNCLDFYVPKVDFSDHFPVVGEYQMVSNL